MAEGGHGREQAAAELHLAPDEMARASLARQVAKVVVLVMWIPWTVTIAVVGRVPVLGIAASAGVVFAMVWLVARPVRLRRRRQAEAVHREGR
jgi:O-antigen ligase